MMATTNLESDIRAGQVRPAMSFNQKVWAITARIPEGRVTTYAEIARALDSKGYRAVGNALNKNPYAPHSPDLPLGSRRKQRCLLRRESS